MFPGSIQSGEPRTLWVNSGEHRTLLDPFGSLCSPVPYKVGNVGPREHRDDPRRVSIPPGCPSVQIASYLLRISSYMIQFQLISSWRLFMKHIHKLTCHILEIQYMITNTGFLFDTCGKIHQTPSKKATFQVEEKLSKLSKMLSTLNS